MPREFHRNGRYRSLQKKTFWISSGFGIDTLFWSYNISFYAVCLYLFPHVSICCNFARNLYLFEFALDFLTNGKTMLTIPYVLVNEVPLGLERANIPVPLSKRYQRKSCCFKVLCRRFFDQKTNPTNSAFFSVVPAFFGLFDEFRRIPTQGSALKPLHFHASHVFSKHSMEEKMENLEKTKSKTKNHSPDRKVARGILAKPLFFFDFLKAFSFF